MSELFLYFYNFLELWTVKARSRLYSWLYPHGEPIERNEWLISSAIQKLNTVHCVKLWGQGNFQWKRNHVLHLLLYPVLSIGDLCPLTTLVPIWTCFIISKLGTNRSHLPRLLLELNDTRILYCMLSLREYTFSRVELENAWQQLLNKDKRHWCFCSYGEKGERGWQRY